MEQTTIIAKDNLYNKGLCFTKGKEYTVDKRITNTASLMELQTINDMGEPHNIGSWWREFDIKEEIEEEETDNELELTWEDSKYKLTLSICEDMYTINTFWLHDLQSHDFWEGCIDTKQDGRGGKELDLSFDSSEPEVSDVAGLLELITDKCYEYLNTPENRHKGIYLNVFTS
jgi:hypothetical protein